MSGPMVPVLPPSLRRAIGVTRVAQLTGLDRTGVEVAAAVRPRGHVLQVCNGKGDSFEQAAAGAVLEAAELWCAEHVEPAWLRFGSVAELSAAGQVWPPGGIGATRIAWVAATDLSTDEAVYVPAQSIFCPPAGQPGLGPAVVRWTSNGMGAHPSLAAATRHALLEAIERDHLARALPAGWTRGAVRSRMIDPASLGVAPRTRQTARRIERGGFRVYLFDLGPRRSLGLPVAGALLVDAEGGPVPLTAGYACAPRRDEALLGALLEAAQSRLTDVHGAREDVVPAETGGVDALRGWCAAARPRQGAEAMPDLRLGVSGIAAHLEAAGVRAAALDLAPGWLGVHVVKVIVPSFLLSELL